jgi:hypothetical protein
MKKTIIISSFLTFTYFIVSCKKDVAAGTANSDFIAAADCIGATPTYTKNIKLIFDTKCATSGCHSEVKAAHGLNLSTYETSKNQFNVHAFLCSINQVGTCSKMPNNGTKLPDADIKSITCWAKNGFTQ